jgi:P27 family predicted phage terminase small subunit
MGRRTDPSASSLSTVKRRKKSALVTVPPVSGMLSPPDWLLPAAKELWNVTGRQLIEMSLMTELDVGVLAEYCQVSANLLEVEAIMQDRRDEGKNPYVLEDGRMDPIALAQLRYIKQQTALAGELGLTPAGRCKLRTKTPDAPHSDLDSYLEKVKSRREGGDNSV